MTNKYGYKEEATAGTNTLDAIIYWGLPEGNEWPFELAADKQLHQKESIAANYTTPDLGASPLDAIPLKFAPCDDRFLYFFYGDEGAINAVGTAKPTFSLYSEQGTRKKEAFGCLLHDFGLEYKLGNGIMVVGQAAGRNYQTSSATPSIGYYDTADPYTAITSVTFAGSSLGEVFALNVNGSHDYKGYPGDSGFYTEINDQMPRVTTCSLWCHGQSNVALETAKIGETTGDLVITMTSKTETLTLTLADCLVYAYKETKLLNEPINVQAGLAAGDVTWVVT
jgi:hypothetical protein